MIKSKIGYWVDKKGLQTKFIAQKLKVSETQVSKWKSGKADPRVEKLFGLAILLGVKVDDLYEVVDNTDINEK